ncbi:unnamed protein product, partial [Allacma fusca]
MKIPFGKLSLPTAESKSEENEATEGTLEAQSFCSFGRLFTPGKLEENNVAQIISSRQLDGVGETSYDE